MTLLVPSDWTLFAKCRGMGDALFPEDGDQRRAAQVCNDCPVRTDCLAEALDHRIEYGIWGGTTERERRALLRRRPYVSSWKAVLTADQPRELAQAGPNDERSPRSPRRRQPVPAAAGTDRRRAVGSRAL